MIFWKLHMSANIGLESMIHISMNAEITCKWLMKLILRLILEKLEKLSFEKIILKYFEGTFREFFRKNHNTWESVQQLCRLVDLDEK